MAPINAHPDEITQWQAEEDALLTIARDKARVVHNVAVLAGYTFGEAEQVFQVLIAKAAKRYAEFCQSTR